MKDEKTAPEKQAEPVHLEDALAATFDQMEADGTLEEDNSLQAEVETEVEDAEVALVTQEDEKGTEARVEEPEGEETLEAEGKVEPEPEPDYDVAAPDRWPDEIKKVYNELPPAAKEAMLEKIFKPMQRSFTEKTQAMARTREQLNPMLDILRRHEKTFENAGIDPVQALERQMEWSAHFARVGNEQGAKDMAAAYGQVNNGQGADANVYLTPVEKRQQAEIDELRGHLRTNTQNEEHRQQQVTQDANEARAGDIRNSIAAFSNETRDGQPTHPHVEKVSAQMAGLIRGGLVNRTDEYGQPITFNQQLGQAYKLACEMDSSIRNVTSIESRRKQVEKATNANRQVVSKSPDAGAVVEEDQTLEESISNLYDRLDQSATR